MDDSGEPGGLLPRSMARVVVEPDGTVSDVTLLKATTEAIDSLFVHSLRGWRFDPATLRGVAIRSSYTIAREWSFP